MTHFEETQKLYRQARSVIEPRLKAKIDTFVNEILNQIHETAKKGETSTSYRFPSGPWPEITHEQRILTIQRTIQELKAQGYSVRTMKAHYEFYGWAQGIPIDDESIKNYFASGAWAE
jgi:hypothetical protein